MLRLRSRGQARRWFPRAFAVAAALALAPGEGRAHFYLQEPASWKTQTAVGSPQKLGPCGNEGGGTPTGVVTAFHAGDKVKVTIKETIFHPGHYRIALGLNGQGDLPAPPPVTPGQTACGSTVIQDPPVFPVLADGVFRHTAPFGTPQSIEITLPPDVTCENCTLQIIEFMSDHSAPCFYYHCANISIADETAGAGGGGQSGGAGSGGGGQSGAGGTTGGGASGGAGGDGTGGAGGTTGGGAGGNTGGAGGDGAGGDGTGGAGGDAGGSASGAGGDANAGGAGGAGGGSGSGSNSAGTGGATGGGNEGGARGIESVDASSSDGCAAATPRAAPPGLAALTGLLAAAGLSRRRRRRRRR